MSEDATGANRSVAVVDELLLDAKLTPPRPRSKGVSRADLIDAGPVERLPGGRRDGPRRLRQVHPAGAVGPRRGPTGGLGLARPLRRRRRHLDHSAGVGLRPHLPGRHRPRRRRRRPRCLAPRARRAAPGGRLPVQPQPVRVDAGRPPRAAGPGLPRRAGRGHRRRPRRVADRGREPSRPTAPPSAAYRGRGHELGPSDLALDATGTEQIFSAANVALTPDLAAAVTERTEGWPAGIYLAALIAQQGDDPADRHRRRPVRGRLPLPRISVQAPRDHPAVPPTHRRSSTSSARRCAMPCSGRGSCSRTAAGPRSARNMFLVPLDRTPGVVPLPRALPRVPPRRAPAHRTAPRAEAAPARRRLVRGQRLPLDGLRAPHQHHRAGPMRPTPDPTHPPHLQRRADVDPRAVALGHRRHQHRGLPATGRARRLGRRADRAHAPTRNGGRRHRPRLVRPGPARRQRLVRIGPGHAEGHDVPRRPRADAGRRLVRRVPRSPPGARGATSALCLSAMARLLVGDLEGASVEFAEACTRRTGGRQPGHDHLQRRRGSR